MTSPAVLRPLLPCAAAALAALLALGAVSAAAAPGRPGSTVLVLGDSLSSGYGIAVDEGWVSLLARRLGAAHRVVNASISGDTTGGGRARLPAALDAHRPDVVIIELGGNDGLRGLPLGVIRDNLDAMVREARGHGARVLVLGMRIPPNLGPVYAERFHALFAEVAERHGAGYVPFLLEGIAGRPPSADGPQQPPRPSMMQPDGIHPTAAAQPGILANVWPALEPLL